jgi:F0F1-type ATP synthase membrane subunit b/b'
MFLFGQVDQVNWINVLLDFKTNFLNWLLLVSLMWWACAKYLPPLFSDRRKAIEAQLSMAAQAKESARQLLDQTNRKISAADNDVNAIVLEARETAEQLRLRLENQTKDDLADLRRKFDTAAANERQMAISSTRAMAVKVALKLTEVALTANLTASTKSKLLNQFVEQLDQISSKENLASCQELEKIH